MSSEQLVIRFDSLPDIVGYIKDIWSKNESTIYEITTSFVTLGEMEKEQQQLVEEIKTDVETVEKLISSATASAESLNFDKLNVKEILEKLQCKCETYKEKYMTKKSGSAYSISTRRSTRLSKRLSDDYQVREGIECVEFLSVKDFATRFIDNMLQEAATIANKNLPKYDSLEQSVSDEYDIREDVDDEAVSVSGTTNILIGNFSLKLGRELVLSIIFTWNLKKHWSYCIDFIKENSDSCTDFYIYEVKWSLPTMSYPIPQVTASVFFTIHVSRIQSSNCPVTVSYTFETERYKFLPEDDIQHEIFLDNILKNKLETLRILRI